MTMVKTVGVQVAVSFWGMALVDLCMGCGRPHGPLGGVVDGRGGVVLRVRGMLGATEDRGPAS